MYTIPGHHHISMITKNAKQNNHFYRDVLGLRRVKITVNQDDPSMYHLFYGDKTGSPAQSYHSLKSHSLDAHTEVQTLLPKLVYLYQQKRA